MRPKLPTVWRCSSRCSLLVRLLAMIRGSWQLRRGIRFGTKIWRIEIVFSGNPDQREKGIPPGIGEGGAHALRRRNIGDLADRPIRRDPFPRRMREDGGEAKKASFCIDTRRLDCCNLMHAKAFADNVQTAR